MDALSYLISSQNGRLSRSGEPEELPLRSLVTWAVIAPCLVAAITYAALEQLNRPAWRFDFVPVYFLFIAEIACLGYGLARGIPNYVWRWIVFCWLLLLINLLLFSHSNFANWRALVVLRSLWAAQVGGLILWAIAGTTPVFYWRYPLAACLALPFIPQAFTYGHWAWNDVGLRILLQWLFLALIAGSLRWRGYAIRPLASAPGVGTGAAPGGLGSHQFGVRHLLIWMTSASLLLAVAKALNLFNMIYLGYGAGGALDVVIAGGTMCLVLLLALWAALGEGNFLLRWSLCLIATPAFGIALESWERFEQAGSGPPWTSAAPWNHVWTVWLTLAAAMLVAILTIVRGSGYRLIKASAPPPASRVSAAANSA